MSLRTNFDPSLAGDLELHVALQLGDEAFVVDVVDATLRAEWGTRRPGDLVVTTEPAVLAGMLYAGLDPEQAIADGALQLDGEVDRLRSLLGLFRLPEPAVV